MDLSLQMYGNVILRKKAKEITDFNADLKLLSEKMFDVMYQARGIGLAAEQVGRIERLFIIDIPPSSDMDENGNRENLSVQMPLVFINPVIISHSEETIKGIEGCLSFPGITTEIERWSEVYAEYQDIEGKAQKIHAKGLLSRAIQHELDHLNGVLFIDRMPPMKKLLIDGKLKKLYKKTKKVWYKLFHGF